MVRENLMKCLCERILTLKKKVHISPKQNLLVKLLAKIMCKVSLTDALINVVSLPKDVQNIASDVRFPHTVNIRF